MINSVEKTEYKDPRLKMTAAFLVILAMAASNFRSLGVYLFLAAGLIYIFLHMQRIKLAIGALPLLFFAVMYFVFVLPQGSIPGTFKIFVCPILWVLGYNMPEGRDIKGIFRIICFLAFGMALHGVLNFFYNIAVGTDLSQGRSLDIWTGLRSATTGQATNFTMLTAIVFWLVFVQKNRWLKVLALALYIVSLIYDIRIGGRSFLVLSGASLVLAVVIHFCGMLCREKGGKRLLVWMLRGAVLVGFAILALKYNVFGIRDVYEGSYLETRLERHDAADVFADGRLVLKLAYLRNLWEYPFGGGKLYTIVGGYAHDLWLDIYSEAGVFAFAAIALYTVYAVLRVVRIVRNKTIQFEYRAALAVYMIVIMLQFFIEPILQGAPMLLYSFIIVDGLLAAFCAKALCNKQ